MRARETIRTLNRLIRCCRGAEAFCLACAHTRAAVQLRSTLRHRSEEWGRYGDELQALVLMIGGEPVTGSPVGAWVRRRIWLAGKAVLLGSSEALVLEEWQFEQQRVLDRYEEALKGYLARRIRRTVAAQSTRIQQRLEQIESLRHEYAVGSPTVSGV
ncbi:MAG TPA: PA2169 family four-helix-bundle protein [Steroidobacteraceae bacterium]|jgi:uncharacterized protein (TIGR02284 family)|nr:PA2169 family four-helix-bundle protein [Steroidobacteraceae bacterium]